MSTTDKHKEWYKAILRQDAAYDEVFYVGVKTTRVFCLPSCYARRAHFDNCCFFERAQEALLASFRPCKKCKPLAPPKWVSKEVQRLVTAIEKELSKEWTQADFQALSPEADEASSQLKEKVGMTLVECARNRRTGIALSTIRLGSSTVEEQADKRGKKRLHDLFSRTMSMNPLPLNQPYSIFKVFAFETPLGEMIAIADGRGVYLLEFVDSPSLEKDIGRLRTDRNAAIMAGDNAVIEKLQEELSAYFAGTLRTFRSPLYLSGTPFQEEVWKALMEIPYGETRSYLDCATAIGKSSATRAVASANGANLLPIIIPCHRVINNDGNLGGYSGGLRRKEWLLEHEKTHAQSPQSPSSEGSPTPSISTSAPSKGT